MIDLGASFSPCFDTLEDLGRACQTRNLAFCPVTFETSDEWGDFSKVTISRFVLKDFGEWEMMIAGEYMEGKDIDEPPGGPSGKTPPRGPVYDSL